MAKSLNHIIFLLFSVAGVFASALAETVVPTPLPGWTTAAQSDAGTPQAGLVLSGGSVTYGSPVIAETDGDPTNGKEVVVNGADGVVYVYRSDGLLLWSNTTPNASCTGSKTNKVLSTPAVGELFGDGVPYVVSSYGGVGRSCAGGVIAFRGSDGEKAWDFGLEAFSKREKFWAFSYSVFSSPALADVDGDGNLEVGFGAFDRNVYLLNSDGSVRWYYNAADTVWSSPAFANVDDDSDLEMIIATDISKNTKIRPPTPDGGFLYAFKTAQRRPTHLSFRQADAYVWKSTLDQVPYSSSVVADVIASNPGPEIIIGSGCFFPQHTTKKRGRLVKVFRLSDGKLLRTLPTSACSSSSVGIGDLNEDGVNDIVATVNGARSVGGDGLSHLIAWDAASGQVLWDINPRSKGKNDAWGGNFKSPVVADLDGNGSLEVMVTTPSAVSIYRGKDGVALTCQEQGCTDNPLLIDTSRPLFSTPAVGDINGDGILELVVAGAHRSASRHGGIFAWTDFHTALSSDAGVHDPYLAPWPMFRGPFFTGNAE